MPAPPDFEPLDPSPFADRVGPLYLNARGPLPIVGVAVEAQHLNRGGRVHGGLLMTLADIALSAAVRSSLPKGATMWTADLHIAFLQGVSGGEWIEALPSIDRMGRSLVHASCLLKAGEQELAKVLATFAVRVPGLD